MKEWVPDQHFSKADFPLKKPNKGDKSESEKTSSDRPRDNPSKNQGSTSQSAKESASSEGSKRPTPPTTRTMISKTGGGLGTPIFQKIDRSQVDQINKQVNHKVKPQELETVTKARTYSPVLDEIALTQPEKCAYVLRHWYWEKPGMGGELRNVVIAERIRVIFHSLSDNGRKSIYRVFSPLERQQFGKLLADPLQPKGPHLELVHRVFLEMIEHYNG